MSKIEHRHIIIRAETMHAPEKSDLIEYHLNFTIEKLIRDIGMKVVLPARSIWVGKEGNEGYTGNAGLETSHFAYHIWNNPDPILLKGVGSKALFQVDLYTCGCLGDEQVKLIEKWIDKWAIVEINTIYLDRSVDITTVYETNSRL